MRKSGGAEMFEISKTMVEGAKTGQKERPSEPACRGPGGRAQLTKLRELKERGEGGGSQKRGVSLGTGAHPPKQEGGRGGLEREGGTIHH